MKKDVEAFKKELENYNYYRINLEGTLELIQINEDLLANLHGIDPGKEHSSSGVTWVESDAFKRISGELDRLNARKELRTKQIAYIDFVLNRMTEATRYACMKIYAEKKSYSSIAREMGLSKRGLFYRIEKELDQILQF